MDGGTDTGWQQIDQRLKTKKNPVSVYQMDRQMGGGMAGDAMTHLKEKKGKQEKTKESKNKWVPV